MSKEAMTMDEAARMAEACAAEAPEDERAAAAAALMTLGSNGAMLFGQLLGALLSNNVDIELLCQAARRAQAMLARANGGQS